jgi:hypothetical protein
MAASIKSSLSSAVISIALNNKKFYDCVSKSASSRQFLTHHKNMKSIFLLIIIFILLPANFSFAKQENITFGSATILRQTSRPKIISRKKWSAKDSIGKVKEHTIRSITIHHTATLQNPKLTIEKKMQNLQNFSQSEGRLASGKLKPAWFDVPYHYYIAFDGKIAEGREIKFVGDTNTEYDPTGHSLIVLEGNFETEQPTAEQLKSLEELAAWLAFKWKVSVSEIKAHNDYAATACPGENLKKLFPVLRQKIGEINKTTNKH